MNKKIIITLITLILISALVLFKLTGNTKETNKKENTKTEENDTMNNKNNEQNNKKSLIIYFSQSGNTENLAQIVKENTNADILELEAKEEYPTNYSELSKRAKEEQENNKRPEIKNQITNLNEYDNIFIGYPIWHGDMPMIIYTLLDTYDFKGKNIYPFVTSGGSGLSGTVEKIKALELNSNVSKGLHINGSNVESSEATIKDWLENVKK